MRGYLIKECVMKGVRVCKRVYDKSKCVRLKERECTRECERMKVRKNKRDRERQRKSV